MTQPQVDKKLKRQTLETLNGWGFKKYIRHCQQPDKNSYGKEITVVEEWSNKEMADFITDELLTIHAQQVREELIGRVPKEKIVRECMLDDDGIRIYNFGLDVGYNLCRRDILTALGEGND